MTAPTPTEGIEPTIRRIATEVAESILARIIGSALARQKAPQEPAPVDEFEAVRKAREEATAKVNAEWCRAFDSAPGLEPCDVASNVRHDANLGRAAAVHQARVDALREAAASVRSNSPGPTFPSLTPGQAQLVRTWLVTRADRLEREQAKTAGPEADVVERRVAEARGTRAGEIVLALRGILGCAHGETPEMGARRVVAERDAEKAKAKANYDEGMRHYLRAEAAEVRVRELEGERQNGERAATAAADVIRLQDSELARVRAELAEAKNERDILIRANGANEEVVSRFEAIKAALDGKLRLA